MRSDWEHGARGLRPGAAVRLASILDRLSKPLGRCQICRRVEADCLVLEHRGSPHVPQCRDCAERLPNRAAARAIDRLDDEVFDRDLRQLETLNEAAKGRANQKIRRDA